MKDITSNTVSNKRDYILDVARAICILWIVGVLHITTYIDTDQYTSLMWSIINKGMYASLATFTFLSGYFLKKKIIHTKEDALNFYIGRFKRFWVPFLIACTSLYIIGAIVGKPWFVSPSNFFLSLCGLSGFSLPMPGTMWYMVMMVFFYAITPLISADQGGRGLRVLSAIAILAILMVFYMINHLDERLLLYYPIYVLGLWLPNEIVQWIKSHSILVFVVGLTLFALLIALHGSVLTDELVSFITGIPFIIAVSTIMSKVDWLIKLSEKVSYASMMMYLFHRQFYLLAVFVFNISLFPNFHDAHIPIALAFCVVLPIIIVGSYYFQRLYDSVINHFSKI